ncbi:unnamed protein product [Phytophthora lilii]|uniref:Unnamed protein product n=1 Tax=Phytophthora lilii TaxID=2077276 RepID=A0A9W6U1U9_9STRA|nr:unnamed protein product [Phytophthora lilii]
MTIPKAKIKGYRQAKLRRWSIAILMSSPIIPVGMELQVKNELRLRHPTKALRNYTWKLFSEGYAKGIMISQDDNQQTTLILEQLNDGIHWRIVPNDARKFSKNTDSWKLRRMQEDDLIVFYAHPLLHGFPWSVREAIVNKHVYQAVKKQAFQRNKGKSAEFERNSNLTNESRSKPTVAKCSNAAVPRASLGPSA